MRALIAPRALSAPSALAALSLLVTLAAPAGAHHVGTYTPKDNEVTTNFKEIKFSVQAGRFGVALGLFDKGPLRAEMRARAARLPAGLEEDTRAALRARSASDVERALMVFFAALARDLALEADRQLADARASVAARTAVGQRFLEAIWRYYNLVDFAVAQRDSKTSVAVRLAFDEAEGYAKGTAAPAAVNPCSGPKRAADRAATAPDPARLREPLRRIAQALSTLIDESSTPARRGS